jgi:hypothetical protein
MAKKEVSAATVANINRFAEVSLRMDNDTLDYYYEVYVDVLLDSKIPDEELKAMREQGWFMSRDKNTLKIYLK